MLIDVKDLGTVWECWIRVEVIKRLFKRVALAVQKEAISVREITKRTSSFASFVDLTFPQCLEGAGAGRSHQHHGQRR